MKKEENRSLSITLIILLSNLVIFVLSILFGISYGSGGETTEMVFLMIGIDGALSLALCIFILICRRDLIGSSWLSYCLLCLLAIAESTLVKWDVLFRL